MTNPDIPHPAMRGFPFGLGKILPFSPKIRRHHEPLPVQIRTSGGVKF